MIKMVVKKGEFVNCIKCEASFESMELIKLRNGRLMCKTCYDEISSDLYCYNCDKDIKINDVEEHKNDKIMCKVCWDAGERIPKNDDELGIDSLLWVFLTCSFCNKENDLRDYHFQFNSIVNKLCAVCPNCDKENEVDLRLVKEGASEMKFDIKGMVKYL